MRSGLPSCTTRGLSMSLLWLLSMYANRTSYQGTLYLMNSFSKPGQRRRLRARWILRSILSWDIPSVWMGLRLLFLAMSTTLSDVVTYASSHPKPPKLEVYSFFRRTCITSSHTPISVVPDVAPPLGDGPLRTAGSSLLSARRTVLDSRRYQRRESWFILGDCPILVCLVFGGRSGPMKIIWLLGARLLGMGFRFLICGR